LTHVTDRQTDRRTNGQNCDGARKFLEAKCPFTVNTTALKDTEY